jgi:hypothetical protein
VRKNDADAQFSQNRSAFPIFALRLSCYDTTHRLDGGARGVKKA